MPRQPDPTWDTLDELFGPTRTRQEANRRGMCVRDLRAAGATPDEIRTTHAYCSRRFTTFTELALLNHLSAATTQRGHAEMDSFLDRVLGEREPS
jgi:hypothetical protein